MDWDVGSCLSVSHQFESFVDLGILSYSEMCSQPLGDQQTFVGVVNHLWDDNNNVISLSVCLLLELELLKG